MFNSTSIKTRFLVSAAVNISRSAISFVSGLVVARSLGPSNYGDMAFLLGTFSAIFSLIDFGASNAFFTFLSRRKKKFTFFAIYFGWLWIQLCLTLIFVTSVFPDDVLNKVWVGQDREIIVLALVTIFLQQQVWQTVNQIGESKRKTVKVQSLNLFVSITYLIVILLFEKFNLVTIENVMFVSIGQYLAATFFAYWTLRGYETNSDFDQRSFFQILTDYWNYCKPLALMSIAVFIYNFSDKWLLQHFGGSIQQGYFQIANQIANVSLIATASILSVFWKEIATAFEKRDFIRVQTLYTKVNRGLALFSAIISGFLIPWSRELIEIILGSTFTGAWPVLALMLFYPIHQSMGQIGGTVFLAKGNTKAHMILTVGTIVCSVPATYLLLASSDDGGWDAGAIGIAAKMVVFGVVSVNIQAWLIARFNGWKFDWLFQIVGIPLVITIGFLIKIFLGMFWNLDSSSGMNLAIPMLFYGAIYFILVVTCLILMPWLVGLSRKNVDSVIIYFRERLILPVIKMGKL